MNLPLVLGEEDTTQRRAALGGTWNRWTDAQQAVFDSRYHLTVWWGANGIGKSVALAELVRRALCGRLWWQTPGQPYTVILVGKTWVQLGSTLQYLFAGVGKGWFRPGVRYESGGVKGQRLAVYDVVGGPGKGGELRCGTFHAENLAGPRADVVATDEPLPESVHNELLPRLLGRQGRMYVTFTPTMGTASKLDYLWELVDDRERPWAGEIQTVLTLDAVTPRGGLIETPWLSQGEIDRHEQGVSRLVADMRMGRSRRPQTTGAYFSAWRCELRQDWSAPAGTLVSVGIDHGSKPGAQRASLVYLSLTGDVARIHVQDHYRGDGRTESEEDAAGILAMLARQGLRLEDVDLWIGDRAHAGNRWGGVKSNVRLQEAIARQLGINTRRRRPQWMAELPPRLQAMRKPRKYDGSVWDECDLLHRAMVGSRFTISRRAECDQLDQDFSGWQAGRTEPEKDGIDSVRYPVARLVDRHRLSA